VQGVGREGEEVLGGGWRSRCEAFGCAESAGIAIVPHAKYHRWQQTLQVRLLHITTHIPHNLVVRRGHGYLYKSLWRRHTNRLWLCVYVRLVTSPASGVP